MPPVQRMVEKAAKLGQPGLALTDHGNMSGSLRLYKECMKAGIIPFPGLEGYLVMSVADKTADRFHITLLALDLEGYQAIGKLSSLSHQRDHYQYKPRFDLSELLDLGRAAGEHVAVLTGCHFGWLVQSLLKGGSRAAQAALSKLQKVFPNLYVEIQQHNIDHGEGRTDESIAIELKRLAHKVGLPVIITQDSHYIDRPHKAVHDMMKNLVMSTDVDATFPGDGYHLASTSWVRKHYNGSLFDIWEQAEDSYKELLDLNRLVMPALDDYKFHMPQVSHFADEELKRRCKRALAKDGMDMWHHYETRLKYELGIIKDMGMANYFLLIQKLCDWCKREEIFVEARGSANGSLVCYVLGITQVDPLAWDLSFDRFLHPTRKKPPDIDLDIDRDKRFLAVEYLASQFDISALGTYSRLKLDEEGRGSVTVKYLSYLRRSLGAEAFKEKYGGVKPWEIGALEPDAMLILRQLSKMNVRSAPGTHAAGFVLSADDQAISDYLPTMLIPSSGTTVTQMTMDDVEEAGYVKADLLGSATLTHADKCLRLIGKNPADGLDWIPLDDKETCKTLRSGRPNTGIFQFEGYSTAKGGKQMGVKSTKDVIFCMALYRTALMMSGHTEEYLARRKDKSRVEYVHDIFIPALKETFGVVVFQDQVFSMLRQIDMRLTDINDLLKAVKQSNDRIVEATVTFDRLRPVFIALCRKCGLTGQQAVAAWEQIMDFNEYGFNRAHATGYGLRAYRMGYLKTHYPLEFMTALLETHSGTEKELLYVREAKLMGIPLLRADVSVSGIHWRIDRKKKGIRRGLSSIKGIGPKAAEEIVTNQPFDSVEDLLDRVNKRAVTGGKDYQKTGEFTGVMEKLKQAGALRSIGIDHA